MLTIGQNVIGRSLSTVVRPVMPSYCVAEGRAISLDDAVAEWARAGDAGALQVHGWRKVVARLFAAQIQRAFAIAGAIAGGIASGVAGGVADEEAPASTAPPLRQRFRGAVRESLDVGGGGVCLSFAENYAGKWYLEAFPYAREPEVLGPHRLFASHHFGAGESPLCLRVPGSPYDGRAWLERTRALFEEVASCVPGRVVLVAGPSRCEAALPDGCAGFVAATGMHPPTEIATEVAAIAAALEQSPWRWEPGDPWHREPNGYDHGRCGLEYRPGVPLLFTGWNDEYGRVCVRCQRSLARAQERAAAEQARAARAVIAARAGVIEEAAELVGGPGVYVIGPPESLRSKIGHAGRSLAARLRDFRCGSAEPMVCRLAIPCADARAARVVERDLHAQYAASRSHGEWFDLPDDALQEIGETYRVMSPAQVARLTDALQPPRRRPGRSDAAA